MITPFRRKLLSSESFLAVVMILLTAVITHGLLISRLGYYYDDWYMLWSGASRGADSLVSLFSMDRPFMGAIYSVFYRVLRDSIPGWHLFALVLRAAGGIAFYWIFTLAWPQQKSLSVLSAMLFVVFPGFLAEPNAATKVNHLIGYGAALFSIALTLQAIKTSRRMWKYTFIVLSILLMAFYMWIYEYMVGLEAMRVALMFWMLRQGSHLPWQGDRQKAFTAAKSVFLSYLPYLFMLGLFVFWRVFIFESTRPATDLDGLVVDYRADPANMALRLVFQGIKDFSSASTFAWFVQPYHLLGIAKYGEIVFAVLTACIAVVLAAGYVRVSHLSKTIDSENGSPFVLILIGVGTTLAAIFPVVLLNRRIDLMDPYKSYALHPSAGIIFIVAGFLAMMKPKFRMTAMIVLLGYSVAIQSMNIQQWANFWEVQKDFWWQLSWRAPNIRDGALVMAYLPDGYFFQQDYEVWGPVNLIYRPKPVSVPRIQSQVLNQDTVLDILEGRTTDPYVRDIFLPRDFRNLLLISQPTTRSCIHVIDGAMPAYSANERLIVQKVGGFSKIDFIDPSAAPRVPPGAIFGKEPKQGWCYYFQQASLARQGGDWARIGELYDTALSAGYKPEDASEYFVFIEGLVNLGRVDDAKKIADGEIKENAALKYALCESLNGAPKYPDSFHYQFEQIHKIICY